MPEDKCDSMFLNEVGFYLPRVTCFLQNILQKDETDRELALEEDMAAKRGDRGPVVQTLRLIALCETIGDEEAANFSRIFFAPLASPHRIFFKPLLN